MYIFQLDVVLLFWELNIERKIVSANKDTYFYFISLIRKAKVTGTVNRKKGENVNE